jgi:hypothetical protein
MDPANGNIRPFTADGAPPSRPRASASSSLRWCAALIVLTLGAAACDDDEDNDNGTSAGRVPAASRAFTVRIENVSAPGTIASTRLDGVVPISPGVFAVYQGANPLFTVGSAADQGTERIAEDGDNSVEAAAIGDVAGARGSFASPFTRRRGRHAHAGTRRVRDVQHQRGR